jgi:hypothetical protein
MSRKKLDQCTFTGQRLEWLKCVNYDRRLKDCPAALKVAFVIATHVTENGSSIPGIALNPGEACISDEAIADKAGGLHRRHVIRARNRLNETGYLNWRRTRSANVYRLDYGQVSRVLDLMDASNQARKEQQKRRKDRPRDVTPRAHLKPPDRTPRAHLDVTPESHIHLRGSPYDERESTEGEDFSSLEVSSLEGETVH